MNNNAAQHPNPLGFGTPQLRDMYDKKSFFSKKLQLTPESSGAINIETKSLGATIKNATPPSMDSGNSDSKTLKETTKGPSKLPLPMNRKASNQSLKLKSSPETEKEEKFSESCDSPTYENEITKEEAKFIQEHFVPRHRPVIDSKHVESISSSTLKADRMIFDAAFRATGGLVGGEPCSEEALQQRHNPKHILRTLTHVSPQITDPFSQSINNGQNTEKFSLGISKFTNMGLVKSSAFSESQPEDKSFSKDMSKEPKLFLESKERGFLSEIPRFDQFLPKKDDQSNSEYNLQNTSVEISIEDSGKKLDLAAETTSLLSEEGGDHLIEEDSVDLSVLCGNSSMLMLKSMPTSPNEHNFSDLSEGFDKDLLAKTNFQLANRMFLGSDISNDFASTKIIHDFNKSPARSVTKSPARSVTQSPSHLVPRSPARSIIKSPARPLISFSPKSGTLKSQNDSPPRQKNTTWLDYQSDDLVNLDFSRDVAPVLKSYIQESTTSLEISEIRKKSNVGTDFDSESKIYVLEESEDTNQENISKENVLSHQNNILQSSPFGDDNIPLTMGKPLTPLKSGGMSTMQVKRKTPESSVKSRVHYHEEVNVDDSKTDSEDNSNKEDIETNDNAHDNKQSISHLTGETIESDFGQAEQEKHDLMYYKFFEVVKEMKDSISLLEKQAKIHLYVKSYD
ncbi:hypothetical protein HK096_008975 [Nowakowskiella sp. JEL0078]|nr:hypothetical protein HK096_008975 [Nowakowskiella sp. JEL0078]